MKALLVNITNAVIDCIWPKTNKSEGQTVFYSDYLKTTDPKYLTTIETSVNKLIAEEEDRKRTVDLKVISLLGLIPIATTIVIGIMAAITDSLVEQNGKAPQYSQYLVWLIYGSAGYTALQLLRAMVAAVQGQKASAYCQMTFTEMQPLPDETVSDHKARIIDRQVVNNLHNQQATNRKVDRMNLAHRAVKNALFGIAFLAAAILIQGILIIT